ncbi:MAG: LamG domain-containing protein [Planctomycetota bacterium]
MNKQAVLSLTAVAMLATCLPAQNLGLKLSNGAISPLYVEVPYSQTLHPQTGITVEAWVTYDESTLGSGWKWPTVARQNQAAGQEAWYLRVDAAQGKARQLTFKVKTKNFGFRNASYFFAVGELKTWTHVAGTYDGTNVKIFINGVLKSTVSGGGPLVDAGNVTGNTLRIGTGATVSNAPTIEIWNGEIEEFRIWPLARTAAEIKATMNQQLNSVPGEVSTFNLNLTGADSSGKNSGKLVNKPVFARNTLKLASTALTGTNAFGTSTARCAGTPVAGVSSAPKLGNTAFAVTCLRSPTSGKGLFWVGLGQLSTPIYIGANIFVDLSKPGILLSAPTGTPNVSRVSLPIPSTPSLSGRKVHGQFLFQDQACSTLLSSSEGLTVTLMN